MIIHPLPPPLPQSKNQLGYVHIYTGDGKGKTTAALGVLLRAAGQGQRVLMIQFLKGQRDAGELLAGQRLGTQVEILQFGRNDVRSLADLQAMDAYLANQALQYARTALSSRRRPDVLILDEITVAVHYDLLRIEDVVDFLDNRHRNTEVILTGRAAHPLLLNMADLVTVMQPVKDYYHYQNFVPRRGIEH